MKSYESQLALLKRLCAQAEQLQRDAVALCKSLELQIAAAKERASVAKRPERRRKPRR
jgi:hypothetical protein